VNRIIYDFSMSAKNSNGYGFFTGDLTVHEVARKMSKNQRRKLERYAIIPPDFFQYLRRIGVIKECDVPKSARTVGWLLDFLHFYPYATEAARSTGEYLYREIIKADIPWLAQSFWKGDFLWRKLEEHRNLEIRKGWKNT
jgi:hypothetical protein